MSHPVPSGQIFAWFTIAALVLTSLGLVAYERGWW